MLSVHNYSEVFDSDEYSPSRNCIGRPYDEKLVAAALLDEATRNLLERGSPDYWNAVEDWMVD